MKLEVTEDYEVCLKDVYSGVMMETNEGNRIGICMRDDTFEINVMPKGKPSRWFRVNMKKLEIEKELEPLEAEKTMPEGIIEDPDERFNWCPPSP